MKILASWKQQRQAERRAEKLAKAQSDEIDRQLRAEWKRRTCGEQHDILLIGIPGSQAEAFAVVELMKNAHHPHTRDNLKAEFRQVICRNLLENSRDIVWALRKLKLDHANRRTKANCEYIMNHRCDTDDPDFLFLPRFAKVVQELWTEDILPLLLDRPFAIPLADNAEYFFAEAQRIAAEDYVPSIEDIGHASEKGVIETYCNVERLSLRVLHVCYSASSQQIWHRKWMDLFEGVTSVLFCVSLCDYDEPASRVSHPNRQTRTLECLNLFEAVVNWPWFGRTSIILFLTGMDKFRTKLQEVPLNEYFPEYMGGTNADECASYIRERFLKLNHRRLSIYLFTTEVSDMTAIRLLASVVKETARKNALKDIGCL